MLRASLAELPAEDQLILRMRFWDDSSVADIALMLRLEQKPFCRRLESIESRLRTTLTARGLVRERARDLLLNVAAWGAE